MTVFRCPTPMKQRYATVEHARAHLMDLKATSRENKKIANRLCVYKCSCGQYHVGHDQYKRVRQ